MVDGLFRSSRRNVTHVNEFRRWPISVEDCPIHRETSNFSVYFRNLLFENDRTVQSERDSLPLASRSVCVVISGLWYRDMVLFFAVGSPGTLF